MQAVWHVFKKWWPEAFCLCSSENIVSLASVSPQVGRLLKRPKHIWYAEFRRHADRIIGGQKLSTAQDFQVLIASLQFYTPSGWIALGEMRCSLIYAHPPVFCFLRPRATQLSHWRKAKVLKTLSVIYYLWLVKFQTEVATYLCKILAMSLIYILHKYDFFRFRSQKWTWKVWLTTSTHCAHSWLVTLKW